METFDFAARPRVAPIRSDAAIARAKRNAVGGKRKRCTKGKNCSAACIAANMVCLVDLPWVGPALGQARRFVMNRMEGSQPGKSQRVLGWEKVSNKGVAPVPAPAPPKAKKAPKAKKVAGPKGAVPQAPATPAPAEKVPTAKVPTAKTSAKKPKIDIEREKAEFKRQPTDVLQGLLKYKSQLAPERIKAIESELKGRVRAKAPTAKAPTAKAPTAKAPAAKTPKAPAASAALREEFRQKLQAKSIEDLQGMVDRFASKIPKDRLQVIKEELAKKKAAAQGQLAPAKAPSAKPTQQSNSFYQDKNKYDFDAAMKMPASFKGIGDFGEVRLLENGQVVKEGKIGQYEAAILNKLKGKEITPELLGVQYRQSAAPALVGSGYGGHVRERNGLLAMGQAPGLPVGNQFYSVSPDERAKMMDAYIKVRGRLHENGIAHNDMHGGNVFYDRKTGKAMLIDMGLAQMSPKAALVEAMGVFNGKDWQADYFRIGGYDTPAIKRLKDNIDNVKGELKKAGIEPAMLPGIRAKDAKLKQVLGKLTDDQAQNFVNQIYKGVISPSSVVPAAKAPTAKPPSAKPAAKAPTAKPTSAKAPTAKAPSAAPAAKPAAQPSVKPSARGIPDAWLKNLSKRPTADLEKLENHADQLNPQQKKLIKDELKKRKQAQGPTAYEPPKSAPGNSFRNPAKGFDFSREREKPGGSVYKGGAQAKEDVIIHRNVSNPNAIKKGKIGQYEVAALEKLKDADIVPPVMGVRYEAGVKPTTVRAGLGGHVKEKDGELAMGIAPGLPIAKAWYAKDKKTQGQILDEYVRAREKLHKNGVAHNDMHAGNVFYDPKTGKMTVIDLGLAQVNPKAALAEALGVFDGNDFQAARMGVGQFKTPVIKQLRQNVEDVKTELMNKHGVAPAFLPRVRTPEAELNKIFKNLTNSEAEALIGKVYAGLPAPKVKPAKSAKPASPNREWLINELKGKPTKELEDFYKRYKGKINPAVEKAHKDELVRRGVLADSAAPASKPAAKAPTAKAPSTKAPSAASAKPAPKPEGVRTKREKMDLDEFKKDIKNEKSEELKNILWGRGRGKDMVAQAKANRDHRNALGKDKVDEIEREVRRRMGKPSEKTPLVISKGHSGAAPKAPSAKPASAKPAAKPAAKVAPKAVAAQGDLDSYKKRIEKQPDAMLRELAKYKTQLGPERAKVVESELKRREGAAAPKAPTQKQKENLRDRDDKSLQGLARQQNLSPSERNAVREEIQRRDFVNRAQNEKTGVLERLDRLGETRLGQARAEAIRAELQRRKGNPQAEPQAPPKQQSAQAAKDSFLEAKKPYNFSDEEKKSGWVKIGKDQQGAQAEDVRLNRNLSQPAALKNGRVGQYEAAALEKLQNVSQVPNLYGVRYDSKASPQTLDPMLAGSLGPHIKDRPGKLAMELKEGRPVYKYLANANARNPSENDRRNDEVGEELLKARKAIHMRGVAHNDMHGGNVLFNESNKKLNVIDFGMAQVSPKAALIEALGGQNGKDFQAASMLALAGGPKGDRYYKNVKKVEQKLKALGLDPQKMPGIRSPMANIEQYFGKLTDSEAQRLIAEIYDGV